MIYAHAGIRPGISEEIMATTSPAGFNVDKLRDRVRAEYDRVAREPRGNFHFHRGPEYACRLLRYDPEELATIPAESTASFAGVGNPHRIGPIEPGETVLDIGCGAGMDLLLAARRAGPSGKAIGVDMTPAMLELVKRGALKTGLWQNIEVRRGIAEELPVETESVDVVISNGVINLLPEKDRAFREVCRVLRPGGRLYLADVVAQRELSLAARSDVDLWAASIGGALPEAELYEIIAGVGLTDGEIVERFDCYEGTSVKVKLSKDLYLQGINFFARKPGGRFDTADVQKNRQSPDNRSKSRHGLTLGQES
jgi:arsenite methyltransferase